MVEQGIKSAAAQAHGLLDDRVTGSSSAGCRISSSSSSIDCSSGVAVWCGKRFQLQVEFINRKLAVSLLLLPSLDSMPAAPGEPSDQTITEDQQQQQQQLAAVQCSLSAVRFGVQEVCRKADKPRSLVAAQPRRWADFFGLGEVSSWEQVRAGLARQHLGVGAGELHVRATLTKGFGDMGPMSRGCKAVEAVKLRWITQGDGLAY
jgi:hypothetical protein